MRYYSFPLQLYRFESRNVRPIQGLKEDGYIGIYVLLGGLNFERFRGRGQPDELWRGLFEYYFELWLAQEIIQTLCSIKAADMASQMRPSMFRRVFTSPSIFAVPANAWALVMANMKQEVISGQRERYRSRCA